MQARRPRSIGRKINQVSQKSTANGHFERTSIRQEQNDNATSDSIHSNTKPLRTRALLRFGWWWEFSAIAISLISVSLILAILLAMENKALRFWKLPIQINSLVAVFSTSARSALLLIFAEGLSQLKWNTFEKQPNTLDRLQTFDDASRGPWGALVFILKMNRGDVRSLAAAGAALTILALAFEPFTQQILEFPSRRTSVANGTAHVYTAEAFALPEKSPGTKKGGAKLTMLLSIIDLLPNPSGKIDSHFVCPSGDCEMPAHWSLAACATDCENTFLESDALGCSYSYSDLNETLSLPVFKAVAKSSAETEYSKRLDSVISANCSKLGPPAFFTEEPVYPDSKTRRWAISQPFPIGLWADNSSQLSEDPGKFTINDIITINTTIITKFPEFKDLGLWPGVTANTTSCKLRYCVKDTASIVLKKGPVQDDNVYKELPLAFSNPCGNDAKCANVTATFQRHTNETREILIDADLRFHFGDSVAEVLYRLMALNLTEKYLGELDARDIAQMMDTVLSSFIRSSQNAKAINLTGKAITMETYVRVKWGWGTFPLIVVLGSVIFLILTILESHSGEQLFKTSVLTGFFVRWEGARESKLGNERQYHYKDLLQEGKASRVRLTKNENGELIFESVDT